ncbi:MAG: alpha/beta hydrolase [Acetobacteraceae bacterium]|nr:alpha/beta hydrolase [Acetobacteraceae bacterium]
MRRLTVEAGQLRASVLEWGEAAAPPVILLHGFPYAAIGWEGCARRLAAQGFRVLAPELRGHGATRHREATTLRSGAQGALGADLLALMDALGIGRAILAGHDWGGRAACVVAALWPARVRALLTVGGYNIQAIARSPMPADPAQEARHWYQWYFHTARGARALAGAETRHALGRALWRMWSPDWAFTEAEFAASAAAWDNPDWPATVLHSYRHRHQAVAGDPAHDGIEAALARQPSIPVPTLDVEGGSDGVAPPRDSGSHDRFSGPYAHEVWARIGHHPGQEAPERFAASLRRLAEGGG